MTKCLPCLVVAIASMLGLMIADPFDSAAQILAEDPGGAASRLSHHYGFDKLEIFKLERRSSNMLAGDLNHDGLTDLILADNSHSRLDVLLQRRTKKKDDDNPLQEREVNSVENDWRFDHRKISIDKQVSSMSLGDFNGDKRTDIAYFGVPDRLVIRYQSESGDWTERRSFRLPDVSAKPWSVAAGDLNNDGRDDLVVLGTKETYLLYQQPDGLPATPKRLMNTSEKLSLIQIADLDGDGRNDLCYLSSDDQDRSLCARLQRQDGQLGPELRFELQQPRGISLFDMDGNPGKEILTIDSKTGRIKMFRLQRPAAKPGELAGRLIQYGFGSQSSRTQRDLATGDLDGDGLIDVVVTDPDAARMLVFRQRKNQGLDLGSTYPGLVGAEHVRMADFDGDKSAEVVVLSAKEKTLGLSSLREGRLTFPQPLPIEGEPVALELADLDGDGRLEIVYISRQRTGRSSKYALAALHREQDGTWKSHAFGEQPSVPLKLSGTPKRLLKLDANKDGRPDFLIFAGIDQPPTLFTTDEKGIPQQVIARGGIQLGDVSAGAVFVGPPDNPIVLAAQQNFARNLQLDKNQQWRVIDQYNADESSARVVGAASINLDGQPGNEVVLIDSGVRKLRVLRLEDNVFRPWREVEIGAFPYLSTHIADLNGDGRDDLLLFGRGKFAVLYTGQTDPTLKEVASFETKLKKTFFADLVAGDLNGDGQIDLAIIDTRTHYVEVLNYDAKHGLRHALHFKVFEEKSFSRSQASGSEPRESVIADVTADGLADLILLTHDRVLLYPQDDGR